jgi:SpoVK/Ycf46/Vps4 family AAA+-type ATPase
MDTNNNIIVWTSEGGKNFYPSRPMLKTIPDGIYRVDYSMDFGSFLSKLEDNNDGKLGILNSYFEILVNDLKTFCDLEKVYKNAKLEFNRAVLLYGEPGCGKKYLANRLANYFVDNIGGVAFYLEEPTDFSKMVFSIKNSGIKQNTKVFVIIEEVASFVENYGIKALSDILKKTSNEDGVYLIATTNFEERVGQYISDRPGMFEQKMLIDYPDDIDRNLYIKLLIEKFAIKTKIKINKISSDTEGLSLSHIKNFVESVFVFGYNYEEILEELKTMKENTSSSLYPPNMDENIGFGDD